MLTLRQPNDWRSHNRVEEHKDMDCTEILWLHLLLHLASISFPA